MVDPLSRELETVVELSRIAQLCSLHCNPLPPRVLRTELPNLNLPNMTSANFLLVAKPCRPDTSGQGGAVDLLGIFCEWEGAIVREFGALLCGRLI